MQAKSLSRHPNLSFFAPIVYWNFSSGNLDLHNSPLIHGWLCKSVPQALPDHGSEELELVHRLLQGPQLVPKVCLPITQWTSGQDSSQVYGVGCWIPQPQERCFCLWMDAEFLLLRRDNTRSILCQDADFTLKEKLVFKLWSGGIKINRPYLGLAISMRNIKGKISVPSTLVLKVTLLFVYHTK